MTEKKEICTVENRYFPRRRYSVVMPADDNRRNVIAKLGRTFSASRCRSNLRTHYFDHSTDLRVLQHATFRKVYFLVSEEASCLWTATSARMSSVSKVDEEYFVSRFRSFELNAFTYAKSS